MNRMLQVAVAFSLLSMVVTPALGQQHGAQPAPGAPSPQMGMQGGGMMGGGMQGGGMMMCPMMSGMMGGGGMMGGQADPKTQGRMLQMRGEMMKAVGDVLIKHGRAMESQPAK